MRTSGTRNMFANASNSLFMVPFDSQRYSLLAPITCAVPPACWIFSGPTWKSGAPSTCDLPGQLPRCPESSGRRPPSGSHPAASRRSATETCPLPAFSSLPRFTIANCFLKMLVKPRLGSRRCSGIWPPSKSALLAEAGAGALPLRPPRADVLPCPEPMPRPIALLDVPFCPAGGRHVH